MKKILKFSKGAGNTYKVVLSDETITLYDDLIIKYELLRRHSIKEELLEQIKQENQMLESYYKALHYLSVKMRTELEVRKYLQKKGFWESNIDSAIHRLKEEKLLDEALYVELYVQDSIRLKSDGPDKIKRKLSTLGISKDVIESYFRDIDDSIWEEKATRLLYKKNQSKHRDSGYVWKQKLETYLKNNGYSSKYYQYALSGLLIEEDLDVLQKEKDKWQRKLSSKYEGKELEFRIKQKLLQKGYSSESISKIL